MSEHRETVQNQSFSLTCYLWADFRVLQPCTREATNVLRLYWAPNEGCCLTLLSHRCLGLENRFILYRIFCLLSLLEHTRGWYWVQLVSYRIVLHSACDQTRYQYAFWGQTLITLVFLPASCNLPALSDSLFPLRQLYCQFYYPADHIALAELPVIVRLRLWQPPPASRFPRRHNHPPCILCVAYLPATLHLPLTSRDCIFAQLPAYCEQPLQ